MKGSFGEEVQDTGVSMRVLNHDTLQMSLNIFFEKRNGLGLGFSFHHGPRKETKEEKMEVLMAWGVLLGTDFPLPT